MYNKKGEYSRHSFEPRATNRRSLKLHYVVRLNRTLLFYKRTLLEHDILLGNFFRLLKS